MTSINNELPPNVLLDNARKLEYKTLIKEKVLKPSKLEQYNSIRTYHSHLVIRDSHYLTKSPTSFITCSSCHRGRVLKIASIQDSTTEEILKEVYSTISKNPCTKKKQTLKDQQKAISKIDKRSSLSHTGLNQLVNPLAKDPSILRPTDDSAFQHQHYNISPNNGPLAPLIQGQVAAPITSLSLSRYSTNGLPSSNGPPPILPHPSTSSSISTSTGSSINSGHLLHRIPSFDDFFDDFEETSTELPPLDEKLEVKSTGSTVKITSYTLSSLFNGHSSFPPQADLLQSLAIDNDICRNFYQNDTLIIPLPIYSNTLFIKDLNKDHYLKDDLLAHTIHQRIQRFVAQPDLNLNSFKIVIVFNYFQEGIPDRPHEHQGHKYVGNIHVIHSFNVLEDSSMTYTNSRYTFNHNYTWVDSKEEAIKSEIFNELIIKKLQNEIFLKYQQDLLGSHINYSAIERGSILSTVNYSVDEDFKVTPSSSLFVVVYITLKILRVLTSEDGLQMITYLSSLKVNTKHNIHLLKLLLNTLHEQQQRSISQLPGL